MHNKSALLISIGYTIVLTTLCLITIDFDSVDDVAPSYSDKIFHFLSYTILTSLWYYTIKKQFKLKPIKALVYVAVAVIIFGIIVEVLQEVFTSTRVFDVFDILSNTTGVLIAVIILLYKIKTEVKK